MRTLNKNKQTLYYANQDREVPITETYYDDEGNAYELDTGETELVYGEPIEFKGNIAMSGGEAEAQEFGLTLYSNRSLVWLSIGARLIKMIICLQWNAVRLRILKLSTC